MDLLELREALRERPFTAFLARSTDDEAILRTLRCKWEGAKPALKMDIVESFTGNTDLLLDLAGTPSCHPLITAVLKDAIKIDLKKEDEGEDAIADVYFDEFKGYLRPLKCGEPIRKLLFRDQHPWDSEDPQVRMLWSILEAIPDIDLFLEVIRA
jgi:hypothetical protein